MGPRPSLVEKKNVSYCWTPVVKMVRRRRCRPSRKVPLEDCKKEAVVSFALVYYLRVQYLKQLLGKVTPTEIQKKISGYLSEVNLAWFLSCRLTKAKADHNQLDSVLSAPIEQFVAYSLGKDKIPKKIWVFLQMELMKQFGPELFKMVIIFQSDIWRQIVKPTQAEPLTEEFVLTRLVQEFKLAMPSGSTADEILMAVVHKCVSTFPEIGLKNKPPLPAEPLTEEVVLASLVQEFGLPDIPVASCAAAEEILTAVVHKCALNFHQVAHDDAI